MFRFVNKLKNRKGFTLIELLVVLAVLAIIALIAVPKFNGIKEQARQKADYATARSIKHSMELAYAAGETATTVTVTNTATTGLSNYVDQTAVSQYYAEMEFTINGDGVVTVKAKIKSTDTAVDITNAIKESN